jgi:hypothetical protein
VSVLIATTTITFPVGCSEQWIGRSQSRKPLPQFCSRQRQDLDVGVRRCYRRANRESHFSVFGPRKQRQDLDVEMNEVGREITGTLNRHAFT